MNQWYRFMTSILSRYGFSDIVFFPPYDDIMILLSARTLQHTATHCNKLQHSSLCHLTASCHRMSSCASHVCVCVCVCAFVIFFRSCSFDVVMILSRTRCHVSHSCCVCVSVSVRMPTSINTQRWDMGTDAKE